MRKTVAFILLLVSALLIDVSSVRPSAVNIGGLFPIYSRSDNRDHTGRQSLGAFLLALDHVRNKTDGFFDNLLPETDIQFTVRDTKGTSGLASLLSVELLRDTFNSKGGLAAVIGASSSSSSISAQNVSWRFNEWRKEFMRMAQFKSNL